MIPQYGLDSIEGIVIALFYLPAIGFAVYFLIQWVADGEIELFPAILAVIVMLAVLYSGVRSQSMVVIGAGLTSIITLLVFFPFAVEKLAEAENVGVEIDRLDKIHQMITQKPENISAYFSLAESVHDLGLEGHAVAICQRTLDTLPTEVDPQTNQSIRDVFRAEEARARSWGRSITDPDAMKAVACPRCSRLNEAGTIACVGCQGPFLLDIARAIDPRSKIRTKLVFAWTIVVALFTGSTYAWMELPGRLSYVFAGLGFMTAALVLSLVFRRRTLKTR